MHLLKRLATPNHCRLSISRLNRSSLSSSSSTATESLPLLYRDVLVFDDTWTTEKWASAMRQDRSGGGTASLKYPSSQHIVAKYSSHMFNNSNYHFNSVGEFSLNISAAHVMSDGTEITRETSSGHSALLWPDRLFLRNLSPADIPAVLKAALDTRPITAAKMKNDLASSATVEPLEPFVVISACSGSAGFSYERSLQSLDWFKSAAVETLSSSPVLVIAEDLKNHRNGTNILVLKGASADSFELQLSKEKVKALLTKYKSA